MNGRVLVRRLPHAGAILVAYALGTAVTATTIFLFDLAPAILTLWAIPIPLFPLAYPRWLHLSSIALLIALATGVVITLGYDAPGGLLRIAIQACTILVMAELVRFISGQRLRATSALRTSEERYRLLLETPSVVPFEVCLDSGRFTYVGPQAERLLGYALTEWTDTAFWADRIHPEDHEVATKFCQEATKRQDDHQLEYRMLAADGHVVWLRNIVSVVPSKNGETSRMRGVFLDITEQRRAEEALRDSEERLARIYASANDAIVVVDPRSETVVETNPRAAIMLGYDTEELFDVAVDSILPDEMPKVRGLIEEVLSARSAFSSELSCRAKDGTAVPVEISASLVHLAGQALILAMVRDVTERRRSEEERRNLIERAGQAQKLESLGLLAGGIAHDFNNLLVGILGNASFALERLPVDSKVHDRIRDVELAAQRAAELTFQMLAYAGKSPVEPRLYDLSELVRESSHLLEAAVAKTASFEFELEAEGVWVDGDAAQLRQVVMNLIANASDALEDRAGTIRLRTGVERVAIDLENTGVLYGSIPPSPFAYVEVSDRGVGMDPETLEKMFDPFFSTKTSGHGLGLAAALGIVRSHAGALHVVSAPQRGTSIRVLLPLQNGPTQSETPRVVEPVPFEGGTVLVADDEELVRRVIKTGLEQAGFRVVTAADGVEAVDLFETHASEVSAVILDMTMPRASGREALEAIRRTRADVPILLTSGYAEEKFADLESTDTPTHFLQKPFRMAGLLEALHGILDGARRLT